MSTAIHARAGELPEPGDLIDVDGLVAAHYDRTPDPSDAALSAAGAHGG